MGKSKQFKKDYASSIKNITGKGVWSGRGIGIPVAGAVDGSSDGSKYLGRPRRPYYDGEQGSPSQSADSTFSSYMARVNKNQDPPAMGAMFPEQEDNVEDSYTYEEPILNTRKMPRKPIMPKRRKMSFNENDVVENSKYSVLSLSEQFDPSNLEADRGSENIADIAGDAFMALADSLTGDVSGLLLAIPAIIKNLVEVNGSANEAEEKLLEFQSAPQELKDDLARELDDIQHDIIRDVIDFIQRIVEAVPLPAIPEEWASFAGGQLTEAFLIALIESAAEAGGPSIAEIYASFMEKLPGPVRFLLSLPLGGPLVGGVLQKGIISAGKVHKALREYKDQSRMQSLASDTQSVAMSSDAASQAREEIMKRVEAGDMDFFFGRGPANPIAEAREILSESIYPDAPAFHEAQPLGFQYRSVPTVVRKSESVEDFEVEEGYGEYAVMYKTDGGNIAYQERNKLAETALRRVIRRKIKSILEESKKKKIDKSDDEEDPVEEISTAVPVSVTPLGHSNSPMSYQDLTKTNAKFFGGASLVDPDSASDIMKKAREFSAGTAGFKVLKKKSKKRKK